MSADAAMSPAMTPWLSFATMYEPPPFGYARMTRDSERMTTARTTHTAIAIGIVSASAAVPANSARTRIASSVAYAEDEMLSEAMIARPVFTESRSLVSSSEASRAPKRIRRKACQPRPMRPRAASASGVAMKWRPRRRNSPPAGRTMRTTRSPGRLPARVTRSSRLGGPSASRSSVIVVAGLVEVVGHIQDGCVAPPEQPQLQQQRGLVVQQRFPPVPRYELGQHDDDGPSGVGVVNGVEIAQERGQKRAVRRDDRFDRDRVADHLRPARLEGAGAVGVEGDVHRVDVA